MPGFHRFVFVFIIFSFKIQFHSSLWTTLEFVSMTSFNGTEGKPIAVSLTRKRIGKGVYGISGTLEATDDLYAGYTFEMNVYLSAKRNNNFKLFPYGIRPQPYCSVLNNQYRSCCMRTIGKYADLPQDDDPSVDLCGLIELGKVYHINNYEFKDSLIPQMAPTGNWKNHILARKDGIVTGGTEIVVDLY